MKITYTCGHRRDVRGNCGHTHRSLDAAIRCIRKDQKDCRASGGYSDRTIIFASDGDEHNLSGESQRESRAYWEEVDREKAQEKAREARDDAVAMARRIEHMNLWPEYFSVET